MASSSAEPPGLGGLEGDLPPLLLHCPAQGHPDRTSPRSARPLFLVGRTQQTPVGIDPTPTPFFTKGTLGTERQVTFLNLPCRGWVEVLEDPFL